jgi:hypothetical protein
MPEMADWRPDAAEHSCAFAAVCELVLVVLVVLVVLLLVVLDELDPQAAAVRRAAPTSGTAHTSRRAFRINPPFLIGSTAAGFRASCRADASAPAGPPSAGTGHCS